jgi:hypothetical protein
MFFCGHCTVSAIKTRWTPRWGPAWDWKGSTYMEAQHWAANGRPKVKGGHMTGAC